MSDTDKKDDDKKFNETLKRMLKTPPKPHNETGGEKAPPPDAKSKNDG